MTDGDPLARTAALVLAAGGSRRLGRPKQLLPFVGATLLDATLAMVRRCGFPDVVVALGGAADEVRATVDLSGARVVVNEVYGEGCSSSIAAALPALPTGIDGFVLLLGDQPMVDPDHVHGLVAAARGASIAVTRYRDGVGHPFWLGRPLFETLATLHGDKGVWRLVDRAGRRLVEHHADVPVPRDVDTWEDYQLLLAEHGEAR
ncbi:nucleotidyltransferase family protein [Nocardioides humi]|uniref:NTP transferase domain-containing protein n=1 Tax=Nocardioides humi TaxID=449461 RepID=A0ABN2AK88_9ACTN|nr:nucleotidyltransferase family protein [Nocardioides humi]